MRGLWEKEIYGYIFIRREQNTGDACYRGGAGAGAEQGVDT